MIDIGGPIPANLALAAVAAEDARPDIPPLDPAKDFPEAFLVAPGGPAARERLSAIAAVPAIGLFPRGEIVPCKLIRRPFYAHANGL